MEKREMDSKKRNQTEWKRRAITEGIEELRIREEMKCWYKYLYGI